MTGEAPLSPAARVRIAEAVARAEAGTAGEIVVMVSARAGLYRSAPLAVALLGGLVLPWLLLWLTRWSAASILLAQGALVAGLLAAGLSERLRLALVPRPVRRARARDAAVRAFHARGLDRTRARTGLLLYVALAEHHAEIVADAGIVARVGSQSWYGTLSELTAALARGEIEAGLTQAVERLGACLAEHVPAGPDAVDELPNRVIVEV